MAKLAYVGRFLAIDAPELFADPEFRAWLDSWPRARWRKGSACCESLFAHVDYTRDRFGVKHWLEGSDVTVVLEDTPQKAIDVVVQAIEAAGLEEFEGLVWLRATEE